MEIEYGNPLMGLSRKQPGPPRRHSHQRSWRTKEHERRTQESEVTGLQPSPVEEADAVDSPSPMMGAPQDKAGGRSPDYGTSKRKKYLREMSVYRPNRRWRLRWRGNLYGGRRRPGLSDFRRHWVKVPGLLVRSPVLLWNGV